MCSLLEDERDAAWPLAVQAAQVTEQRLYGEVFSFLSGDAHNHTIVCKLIGSDITLFPKEFNLSFLHLSPVFSPICEAPLFWCLNA